jgi:hypothetical protein
VELWDILAKRITKPPKWTGYFLRNSTSYKIFRHCRTSIKYYITHTNQIENVLGKKKVSVKIKTRFEIFKVDLGYFLLS